MDAGLDKDTLLIRSIASILHVVHPQATESSNVNDSETGLFNRLALLFVTGEPGDVAAVVPANSNQGMALELLALGENGEYDTILLSKNSATDNPEEQR